MVLDIGSQDRDRQSEEAARMTTTHRITIGVVLALALASSASASARQVDLNTTGSEVAAATASSQTTSHDTTNAAPPFVRAASARVAHQLAARDAARDTAIVSTSPHSEVIDNGGYGPPNAAPVVLGVTAGTSGFDWGDAAIGAAGGIALTMIGLAAALAASQRRTRRASRATALTS
jgi:hypothetical protein